VEFETRQETQSWPWLQRVLLASVVFSLAVGLANIPELLLLLTVATGFWAALTWVAHFDRPLAQRAYKHWLTRPIVIWVHRVEGLPLTFDLPKPDLQLLPKTDADWHRLEASLIDLIGGYDGDIAQLVKAVRDSITLRAREKAHEALSPIGAYLLVGLEALGKRTLAVGLGSALYGGFTYTLDCTESVERLSRTLGNLTREHAHGVVILENFSRAPEDFKRGLHKLLRNEATGLQHAAAVGAFRNWFFFCICHGDASTVKQTLAANAIEGEAMLGRLAGVNAPLLARFRAKIVFVLPDRKWAPRVIANMFFETCRRRGLKLVKLGRDVILDEYYVARQDGNFMMVYERVQRKADPAILDADSRKAQVVEIE
jgi:hypothetical protein